MARLCSTSRGSYAHGTLCTTSCISRSGKLLSVNAGGPRCSSSCKTPMILKRSSTIMGSASKSCTPLTSPSSCRVACVCRRAYVIWKGTIQSCSAHAAAAVGAGRSNHAAGVRQGGMSTPISLRVHVHRCARLARRWRWPSRRRRRARRTSCASARRKERRPNSPALRTYLASKAAWAKRGSRTNGRCTCQYACACACDRSARRSDVAAASSNH
jgi:hypothetical protein